MKNTIAFAATGIDWPQFDNLQNELRRELDPQGFLENEMFGAVVQAAWNRRRVAMLLADLDDRGARIDPLANPLLRAGFDRLSQYEVRYERALARALKELRTLQASRGSRRFVDVRAMPVPAPLRRKTSGKVLPFVIRRDRERDPLAA